MKDKGMRHLPRIGLLMAILFAAALAAPRDVAANTPIVVNTTGDAHDANPGDGVCETAGGNGVCTLRAAIEEAEALPGADTITFSPSLPYPATFFLSFGHLEIYTDLTITGSGSDSTIIDGEGSFTHDRVFLLTNAASTFTVTISGVTIQKGSPTAVLASGGGIALNRVDAHLLLSDVTFTNNAAPGGGGGLFTVGTTTLDHCTVSGNTTAGIGGGILTNGILTATSSTIQGNSAPRGGGLYNETSAKLVGTTVNGNTATIEGAGLYDAGQLFVINTTVTENHSSQNGAGIFVYGSTFYSFRSYNATITSNSCNLTFTGCGIYAGTGSISSIANTILAQNYQRSKFAYAPDDCNGAVTSQDYNLIQTTAGCTITGATSNNIYNTDPGLGPLQYNGGPTQTDALLSGSPAIDAGNPAGCKDFFSALLTTDERGFPRSVNGRCDMGAYEYAPPPHFYTIAPCRAVDTRSADAPPLAARSDREFTLVGKCLIPTGARAVSLNVTVTAGTSPGDLRIYPADTPRPLVSSINFARGQTRANNAIASLSGSGAVVVHDDQGVGNSVQVILDVNGYFE